MNYRILLLILLFATFPTLSVASVRTVRVKVIEHYEFDAEEYEADPLKARRWLTGVSFFNEEGKVAERWNFTNDSSGASYRRYVYTYDRNGRTIAELVHISGKTGPGQYFSASRSRSSVRILPTIADALASVTINRYDRLGNLIEVRITDADGELKQRHTHAFSAGKRIGFTEENGDSSIACKWSRTYTANYAHSTTRYENCAGSDLVRDESNIDLLGRHTRNEQFSKSSNAGDLPVRTSLSISRYDGDATNLEWFLWNRSGQPTKKLLIVSKGDYEISRKEFVPTSTSSDGKLGWAFSEEETREYEFDKLGNLVLEMWRIREAADKPFRLKYVMKNVVTYL